MSELERLREALEKLDEMISSWARDQGFPREQSACWQVVRAALAATPPGAERGEWKGIESYPVCTLCGSEQCGWGPEVALLAPACEEHHAYAPTAYVGHREAGHWLVRDASEPTCWSDLHCAPTHWRPLPAPPSPPASEGEK